MNATQTLAASSYSNTLSDSGTRKRKVVMEISRNLLDMVRDFYSIGQHTKFVHIYWIYSKSDLSNEKLPFIALAS